MNAHMSGAMWRAAISLGIVGTVVVITENTRLAEWALREHVQKTYIAVTGDWSNCHTLTRLLHVAGLSFLAVASYDLVSRKRWRRCTSSPQRVASSSNCRAKWNWWGTFRRAAYSYSMALAIASTLCAVCEEAVVGDRGWPYELFLFLSAHNYSRAPQILFKAAYRMIYAAAGLYVFHKCQRQYAGRDDYPRCQRCGYILLGLADRRCPECGTSFDAVVVPGDVGD